MLELQQHTGKLKAENYGLWEFLQDLQQGINQGYELDDSNEGWPQTFGSLYTCLLKPKAKVATVEVPKVVAENATDTEVKPVVIKQEIEVLQAAKRGLKPKN